MQTEQIAIREAITQEDVDAFWEFASDVKS